MAVVGQLLVQLSANVARLQSDMNAASKVVQTHTAKMARAAETVTTAFTAIGAGLSVGMIVGSFTRAIDSMDAFNDVADKTGASVESLSSLVNTLAPFGHNLDDISTATDRLIKSLSQADDETKGAGEAFKALGIATRDASGAIRPANEILFEVSRALAEYGDGSDKTAMAVRLFGKEGANLIPLLKDLAEAEQRAATVTAEQAEQAKQAKVAINEFNTAILQLQQAIASAALPSLVELYNKLQSIARLSRNPLDWFSFTLGGNRDINAAIAEAEREIAKLDKIIEETRDKPEQRSSSFNRLPNPVLNPPGDAAFARKRRAELEGELVLLREVQKTQRELAVPQKSGGLPDRPKTGGKETLSEAQKLLETLQRQLRATQDLTTEQDVLAQIGSGKLQGLTVTLEQQLLLTATLIDKERERAAAVAQATAEETADYEALSRMKRQAANDLDNEIEAIRRAVDPSRAFSVEIERIKALLSGGLIPADLGQARLDQLNEVEAIRRAVDPTRALWTEIERIKTLLFDGLIPADLGQARLDQLSMELRRVMNDVGVAADETKSQVQDFLSPISSAFEELIFSGGKARDILRGLAQDAARILVRQQITGPLAALMGGADVKSQGNTLIGRVLGSIGFLADGGRAAANRPYVVGERGAELFVPKTSGTVVPNHALGGGPNITFNVQVASGASRQDVLAGIDAAVATAEQRILRSMRTGGAFARA